MDSSHASAQPEPHPKLGPESPLYDPLPTPTSIRVLLLAPGQPEDDIFCCFFPCDLDKDRAVDPTSPRPFKSLSFAEYETPGLDCESVKKRFAFHVDMYNAERQEGTAVKPAVGTTGDQEQTARSKGKAPAASSDDVEQTLSEVIDSFATSNMSEKEATFDERWENYNKLADGEEVSDRHQRIVYQFSMQYVYQNFIKGSDEDQRVWVQNDEAFESWRARFTTTEMTDSNDTPDLLTDDDWDLLQLARAAFWEGSLETQLHPFQRFAALSYVWGSPKSPKSITIDVKTKFWVTENLYDALKSLRRSDKAMAFWIDAICINQDDSDEKQVQIGLMRRIYKQAHEVLAYIPQSLEDRGNLNKLLGLILRADERCRQVLESGPMVKQHREENEVTTFFNGDSIKVVTVDSPVKPTGTCIEDHGVPTEDDPIWDCWRRFFASPYFTRIWILQEYTLAKVLHFRFSRAQGESDTMLIAMDSVDRRSRRLNNKYLSCDDDELSMAAFKGWNGFQIMAMQRVFARADLYNAQVYGRTLIQLLPIGMSLEATDPRDKIYGMLGLATDANDFMDLVSYKASDTYPQIYRRFARRFVEKGDMVQMLRMTYRTLNHVQMPSWVPDWSSSRSYNALSDEYNFLAGGDESTISVQIPPQYPDQLHVTGWLGSTVVFMTDVFLPRRQLHTMGGGQNSMADLWENILRTWHQLATGLGRPWTELGIELFDPLTMQPHKFGTMDEAPSESYTKDFGNFMALMARLCHYETSGDRKKFLDDDRWGYAVENVDEQERDFVVTVEKNTMLRRFCLLGGPEPQPQQQHQIALVPDHTEIGDRIAILRGVPAPLILRLLPQGAVDDGVAYEVVGDAYVAGMMMGEVLEQKEGFTWEKIVLM